MNKTRRKAGNPANRENHAPEAGMRSLPPPRDGEQPIDYADRVGTWYSAQRTVDHRKEFGLYLTPVPVARFMAERTRVMGEHVRVLDPSAGAGVLICGAVEALAARRRPPSRIEVVAYEVDRGLIKPLKAVLNELKSWCADSRGVEIVVKVVVGDFVLAHAEALSLMSGMLPYQPSSRRFDVVVANPPYFKVPKTDPRAVAASSVVHGQPNIYGLFMAVCAALLRMDGDFVFIVPRSFTSGPYFRLFRERFFVAVRPETVHVFASRREAFRRDEVLQENIIFCGVRDDDWHLESTKHSLTVTSSNGAKDIGDPEKKVIPLRLALDSESASKVLRLPTTGADVGVIDIVDGWTGSLGSYGLNISTGPVVPFRAMEFIDKKGETAASHAPLIWMNHVRAMRVSWPNCGRKPEYIRHSAKSLLLPSRHYVLLRRFSSKEERRRLTAAPFMAGDLGDSPLVGFENHLNYVHRPGGMLSEDEAWGLAALYNSALLDSYFRCINGNTQVSATEIRAMPLPPLDIITAMGRHARNLDNPLTGLDQLVMDMVTNSRDERKVAKVG